jgi:hypothetical protein
MRRPCQEMQPRAGPARKCSREPALPALSKGTCHRANVDSMTYPWKRGKQAGLWAVPIDAAIVSMRHCTRLRHIHVNSMQQQPRVHERCAVDEKLEDAPTQQSAKKSTVYNSRTAARVLRLKVNYVGGLRKSRRFFSQNTN